MINLDLISNSQNDDLSPIGDDTAQTISDESSMENKAIKDAMKAFDESSKSVIMEKPRKSRLDEKAKNTNSLTSESATPNAVPTDNQEDGIGYLDAITTAIGEPVLDFYDGLENIALAGARLQEKSLVFKAQAINSVVKFFGGKGLDEDKLDEAYDAIDSDDNVKIMKSALRISEYANEVTGSNFVPSTEDIRGVYEDRVEKIKDENTPLSIKAMYYIPNIATEMGLMMAAPWGRANGFNIKSVQKVAVVAGGVKGIEAEATHTHKEALEIALKEYGIASAFGHALGGVAHGVKSYYFNSATAKKVLDGFEQHAKESKGAVAVEKAKDEYTRNSRYATWDAVPTWDKALYVMGMSAHGEAQLAQMSRYAETSQAIADSAKRIDNQMVKDLEDINDLAGTYSVATGKKITNHEGVTIEAAQSEAYALLHRSGLFKGAKAGSGVNPQGDLTGAGFDLYDAIMKGAKGSKDAVDKISTALRIIGNGMSKEERKLMYTLSGGIRPIEAKAGSTVVNEILAGVRKDTGSLETTYLADAYPELAQILKNGINATMNPREIDDVVEISVSPHSVWSLYKNVRDGLEQVRAKNGAEVVDAEGLLKSIISYIDKVAPDTDAGAVLHRLIDFEGERIALVANKGLSDIAKNSGMLSPREMRQAFYKIGMNDPKVYKKVMSSIPTKAEQETFELAVLRAFAYQGKGSLAEMRTARDFAAQSKSTTANLSADRVTELGAFQPVTLAGRQMKEYLQISARLVDKITESLPTKGSEISLYTVGYRALSSELFKVIGMVQSPKNAVANMPYVLSKMQKLAKQMDGAKGKSVINLESVKAGSTIVEDVNKFPLGVMHLKMANIMKSLKPFTDSKGGGGKAKPTSPTPPPSGTGSPTPTPPPVVPTAPVVTPTPPPSGTAEPTPPPSGTGSPMPEPTVMPTPPPLATVLPEMIKNGGKVPDLALLTPADKVALDDIATNALGEIKAYLAKFQADKGMPLSAQVHTHKEWADYNKAMTIAQRGNKTKIIVTPDGQPAVVVGAKQIKLNDKTKARMAKNKVSVQRQPILDALDDESRQAVLDMAKSVGKPDLFDNVKIEFNLNTPNSSYHRISKETLERISGLEDNPKIRVGAGISQKGKTDGVVKSEGATHTKEWTEEYTNSIAHEIQHHMQRELGISVHTSEVEGRRELGRRVTSTTEKIKGTGLGKSALSKVQAFLEDEAPKYFFKLEGTTKREMYDYIGHDPIRSGEILDEELIHQVVSRGTGMNKDEVKATFSAYEIYRQEADEVEARLMGFISQKGQLDFSDPDVFHKFLEHDATRSPLAGVRAPITTIWQSGADLDKLLGKWDFLADPVQPVF